MIKETLLNTVTETVLAKINKARLNDNQIVTIQKQREQRFVLIDFLKQQHDSNIDWRC